jgi:hypothetical protein
VDTLAGMEPASPAYLTGAMDKLNVQMEVMKVDVLVSQQADNKYCVMRDRQFQLKPFQ